MSRYLRLEQGRKDGAHTDRLAIIKDKLQLKELTKSRIRL
jgi:hypothetical protein